MSPPVDRRTLLKALGMAALGAGVGSGCSVRSPAGVDAGRPKRLARVDVAWDRVIRTVAGLRPYRPSGFVLRSERMGPKTVIHNYGHGGGGVTLSWGTAHMAVEEASKTGERRCAVIGCGAVGLATAALLERGGFAVTIYAKDLPPNTTSNIAGAQWTPSGVSDSAMRTTAFDEQFERACRLSYRYFQDLLGDRYGVRWIDNYELSDEPFADRGYRGSGSPIRDLYPDVTTLSGHENPFEFPFVRRFPTMFVEPLVYLDALMREFLLFGGKIEVREFASRDEVMTLPEPLIVNCTGLGARALFHDEELLPIKGQLVVLLPQPEVDYAALNGAMYMFPRRDGILLGSTYEAGVWDLEPSDAASRRIVDGQIEIFKKVKGP